ncbi:hypothetical protein [Flavobacterium sp. W22_SRS_FP1]|uniref:hypothetical protein n=1 Tax=Flavobacterium sp. W22_SRS_FP1 TaxID=3240276 RepID=UPI003F8F5286
MKALLTITLSTLLCTSILFAQDNQKEIKETKYRRSSLHTILIESSNFPKVDQVLSAYYNAPFPDKYDNHDIGEKSFSLTKYSSDTVASKTPEMIEKYFKDQQIAKKIVAKWFNRQDDGSFDYELVGSRGAFNASFLDTKTAAASSDGKYILQSAGFELINNTFVVVSSMYFVENEPIARGIRDAAILLLGKANPLVQKIGIKVLEKAYEKAKEGYSVWTTSYLYKLKWDETTQGTFFQDMYAEKNQINPIVKAKFDTSDIFEMEFVGSQKATTLVTFSLKEKRTEEQIINLSVTLNIEKVFAKLQKNYDVFKPKVPLFTGEPITAKIGLKEGLEDGDKFEVLEAVLDEKSGKIEYKNLGTLKVDGQKIWDNRFILGDEPVQEGAIDRTTFKGGKKFYPGLLIRQIK